MTCVARTRSRCPKNQMEQPGLDENERNTVKIGFVGLGAMGRPMALNLMQSGADMIVASASDRHFAELAARGAQATTDAADVAIADIVFLCLPGSDVVREVI